MPGHVPMRVTGTAIFPPLDDTIQLGVGAELTAGGLLSLAPPGVRLPPFNGVIVKFRDGVSPRQGIQALAARVDRSGPFVVSGPTTPADLVNFGQLQDLPLLLGLPLVLLALLTVAHLLLTSVRRRRRDLAVLRAIGFTAAQVRSTISWIAIALVAVALVIGVPVGAILGRLAWRLFGEQLGIVPVTVVPVASVAVLAVAGLVLARAIAVVPGVAAGRARPGNVLRAG